MVSRCRAPDVEGMGSQFHIGRIASGALQELLRELEERQKD